jgi:hypothetical protein
VLIFKIPVIFCLFYFYQHNKSHMAPKQEKRFRQTSDVTNFNQNHRSKPPYLLEQRDAWTSVT